MLWSLRGHKATRGTDLGASGTERTVIAQPERIKPTSALRSGPEER